MDQTEKESPQVHHPPGERYDLLRGKQQECIILHTGQFPPCSLINTPGIILTIWISQLPCQTMPGGNYMNHVGVVLAHHLEPLSGIAPLGVVFAHHV